jgi:hypothetical protein
MTVPLTNTQPEANPTAPLPPRTARFAALLETWQRRTLKADEIWQLWNDADPASAGKVERRTDLAEALRALAKAGLITTSRTLDRSAEPALPIRITLPAPQPSASAATLARSIAWRPELSWVAETRLSVAQVEMLRHVNLWLRDRGRDDDIVPMRERSLEIFGHEKALDRHRVSALFGPGRLSLTQLRAFRTHPPLPAVQIGDGDMLLVVENEDTFHSLTHSARPQSGPLGWLAWGAGGAFESSVRSAPQLPGVRRVRYFGDLDFDGLRIPVNAADTATSENLIEVLPAIALYRLLADTGVTQGLQPPLDSEAAAQLASWLRSDPNATTPHDTRTDAVCCLPHWAAQLLITGHRAPQEAVGTRLLAAHPGWTSAL